MRGWFSLLVAVALVGCGPRRYVEDPLARAVRTGSVQEVEGLLAAGHRPDGSPNQETPLVTAARAGDADMVATLLRHGADPNGRVTLGYYSSPLAEALRSGHAPTVQALLDAGAKTVVNGQPMVAAAKTIEVAKLVLAKDPDLTSVGQMGADALSAPVAENRLDVVEYLLRNGAAKILGRAGYNHLEVPASQGKMEMLDLLLRYGANPNYASAPREHHSPSVPLASAARNGEVEAVELLLARGADPKAANAQGETPLHAGAEAGQDKIVRQLVRAGAKVDVVDRLGRSALFVAVVPYRPYRWDGRLAPTRRVVDTVRELLRSGADPNVRDRNNWSVLTRAVVAGDLDVVRELRAAGGATTSAELRTAVGPLDRGAAIAEALK